MFGFLKGGIDINLDKTSFSPGDTVSGNVILKLKKPVKANGVKVRVLGEKKTKSMQGSRMRHRTMAVFDFEETVDKSKEYPADKEMKYKFSIKIPSNVLSGPKIEGALGGLFGAAQLLSGFGNRIDWYVIAKLDVPLGFDISKKVKINVG